MDTSNNRLSVDILNKLRPLHDRLKHSRLYSSRIVLAILATLPVAIFFYQYLASGSKMMSGDFEYYAQMYEAMRISILHFHQFPLWNPWMSGGIPLFTNPQFGLFSIQSLLVLPFGAIYGLKLSYVIYAICGFWGMYMLARKVVRSSSARSLLVAYIWIFCGFFAGHNISHYTFSLFFLMPWLFFLVAKRNERWSWLWFGILESVIILSSIHYAFLMTIFVTILYFFFSLFKIKLKSKALSINWQILRKDVIFCLKSFGVIIILAGYRFITTYYLVSHNQRISPALLIDKPNQPSILIKAIFLPIGTHLGVPPHLQWGWGEYSMYIGLGAGLAFIWCVISIIQHYVKDRKFQSIKNFNFVASVLLIGLITFGLALGDFSKFAPFHLLRDLPGFSQTRVAGRWLFFTIFSILVFLAAWVKNHRAINILLALSVIELFLTYGPPAVTGTSEFNLPSSQFSSTFTQYNNGRQHLDEQANIMESYYYSTSINVGEIYSDDSLVDTLDGVLPTSLCGINKAPQCTFVLTHNAQVTYWSPNKITLRRTAPGPIQLDMNMESGWRINNVYPVASISSINPSLPFVLPGNQNIYTLVYAPKFSPSWLRWRIGKF